jgi:hypothetical protein
MTFDVKGFFFFTNIHQSFLIQLKQGNIRQCICMSTFISSITCSIFIRLKMVLILLFLLGFYVV